MSIPFFLALLLLSVVLLTILGAAVYLGGRREAPAARPFSVAMLLAAAWALLYGLYILSPDLSTKIDLMGARFPLIAAMPVVWLVITLFHTGHAHWLNKARWAVLLFVPVITSCLSLTMERNTLFRYDFRLDSSSSYPTLLFKTGWWFWIHIAYCWILFLIILAVMVRSLRGAHPLYRRQTMLILIAVSIPSITDGFFQFGITPLRGYNFAPVSFVVSGFLIAWALFQYRMFDLVPVARDILITSMSDGVVVLDVQDRIVDINPAARQLLWPDPASPIGKPVGAVLRTWPDPLAGYRNISEAQAEIRVGPDTAPRYLDLRISPLVDRRKRLNGRLVVLRDITKRKKDEEHLRQLSQAVEQSPTSVIITDLQANITYVNSRFSQLTGYSREEIIGQNPRILKSGQTLAEVYQRMWNTLASGNIWHGEFLNKKKSGELYWEFAIISPVKDAQGLVTNYLAVKEDITERKRAEAAVQELNTSLERQVKERTAQLQSVIQDLQIEIVERNRAEEALRHSEENLVERLADQSHKLTTLYEVILMGSQPLGIKEALEQSLDKVTAVLGGEAACVHQWDEQEQALKLAVQHGLTTHMQNQVNVLPKDWLPGDGIPRTVSDLSSDIGAPGWLRLPGFRAYLGAPITLQGKMAGTLSFFWRIPRLFSVEDIALFSVIANQLGVIIENARLRQRSEQAAVLEERRRLARDLHDSVTQSLHSLTLGAETAMNRLKQGELSRLDAALGQLTESARQALKEMRLLLYELRLAPLEQVNLVEVLQTRLETVERRAGEEFHFEVQESLVLPKAWEGELYFIATEALNNVLKHARAGQVTVRLWDEGNWVELVIEDNGRGFDPHRRRPGGMGLQNISERVERLQGVLKIDSTPGKGTRVQVRLPRLASEVIASGELHEP